MVACSGMVGSEVVGSMVLIVGRNALWQATAARAVNGAMPSSRQS